MPSPIAQKGHKKIGGRKKGTRNIKTDQWKMFVKYCMGEGMEKFRTELNKLQGAQFIQRFTDLLEYHKPKLQRSELAGDPNNPIHINANIKEHHVIRLPDGEIYDF